MSPSFDFFAVGYCMFSGAVQSKAEIMDRIIKENNYSSSLRIVHHSQYAKPWVQGISNNSLRVL